MEKNIYSYDPKANEQTRSSAFPALMSKVYLWMMMALTTTGLTALYVAENTSLVYTLHNHLELFLGLLIAELALVWFLSARIMKISFATAGLMFAVYSILNGVVFSSLMLLYTYESIVPTFFITAGTFGSMTLWGLFTKHNLSGVGNFLIMALFGLIIATIVNLFMHSSVLGWAITYVGVLVFCGLTAYDTQKMKEMLNQYEHTSDNGIYKIALMCSFSLYLDFINLFLYLLRIFGDRR